MKQKFLSLAKNIRMLIIIAPIIIGVILFGVYAYIDIYAIGLVGLLFLLLSIPFIVWECQQNKANKALIYQQQLKDAEAHINEELYKTGDSFDATKINERIVSIDNQLHKDSFINTLPSKSKSDKAIKHTYYLTNLKLTNEKDALLRLMKENFPSLLNNEKDGEYKYFDVGEIVKIPEGKEITGHNESTIKVRGVQYSNYDADTDEFDENSEVFCKHLPTDKYPESTSIIIDEVFCGHLEQEYATELVEKYGKDYCLKGKFVEARKQDGYDIIIVSIIKPTFTKIKTPKVENI